MIGALFTWYRRHRRHRQIVDELLSEVREMRQVMADLRSEMVFWRTSAEAWRHSATKLANAITGDRTPGTGTDGT